MTEPDRAGAPRARGSAEPLYRRVRRHPVALSVTVLVVLGALVGPSALSTPTGTPPANVSLHVSWGYLLMAPAADVLDTLSVLTLDQHFAVLATLVLAFVAWRVFRTRTRLGPLRRLAVEAGAAVLALAGLLGFYGYGIVGPRPMAALAVDDRDVLIVDVHSHTDHSHDGRDGFDAAANRAWHAGAGYDAAYVSDHRTWAGWRDASPSNPDRAGDGTVLLPALEIAFADRYASALGEPGRYRSAVDGNTLIVDSLYALLDRGGRRPTLVLTIPERLDRVLRSTPDSIGFVAIEVSDASPRGLEQSRRDRALILRMADSLDLAPVAASNNHGWGRTAAAWTLLRLPGWQAMTPGELGAAIEERLHRGRRDASRVVERRSPYPGDSPVALALTAPVIGWQMFGGLGTGQRLAWLAWTWLLALGAPPVRRRIAARAGR